MSEANLGGRIPPVATILTPTERGHVDVAGAGVYRAIHRNSPEEVLRDLRERRIGAVLLSVSRCEGGEAARVASVVREFPHVPAFALITQSSETNAETALELGNCGVRTIVDVRHPSGWRRLRELLGREAVIDTGRSALAVLRRDLAHVQDDCWRFFDMLFQPNFHGATVNSLARQLGVLPTTLVSRFFRAGLPAPKRYLAFARLVRAARLLENPGFSISDVANHLDYSSPQSFGRHVRVMLRVTAGQFRTCYGSERMLQRFREELVLPHLGRLRAVRPLVLRAGGRPRRRSRLPIAS